MDKFELGMKKASFQLPYGGGEIWCEHLDALGDHRQAVLDKFHGDLPRLRRPSASGQVILILNETRLDAVLLETLLGELETLGRPLRKVAVVGVEPSLARRFRRRDSTYALIFLDDLEKAKEWLL